MSRILFIFLSVFILVVIGAVSAFGATENPILLRSGCEIDYPPFCQVTEDGRADGFSVRLLDKTLQKMGYSAIYETGEWPEIRKKLEDGELDVLPLVGRTPEREKLFDFSVPYMTLHGAMVLRRDRRDVFSIHDLKGREVAVMLNDNAHEFLQRNDFDLKIVPYPSFAEALKALNSGLHDAVVMQKLVALRLIKELSLTNLKIAKRQVDGFHQDFCFAVPEGKKELLAILNEGLSKVISQGIYDQQHARWFADLELEDNRIVVGSDYNFPPFEYIDENGNPAGFNYDLLKAVASETGLQVEFKPSLWPDTLDDLETGKIDMIQGMFFSPERATRFVFSAPVVVSHCVAVTRKDAGFPPPQTFEELKNRRIVVEELDIMHDFVIKHGLASFTTTAKSQPDALFLLSAGQYDCALVSRMTASHVIEKNGITNLVMARDPLFSPNYCFSSRHEQKGLMAKLNEGLKIVARSGEFQRIQQRWFGIEATDGISIWQILRYAGFIVLPLLLAVLIFFFWSYSLKQQVHRKTEDLRKSEEQFRALIEGAPYAIFVQVRGTFAYLNQAAISLFGIENADEYLGNPVLDVFHEESHVIVSQRIQQLNSEKIKADLMQNRIYRRDGSLVPVEVCAAPASFRGENGALVFLRDISQQLKLEDQLRQSSKMEAVGNLAGGVAHDYNNMLSVIIGYAELILAKTPEDDPDIGYLKEIYAAGKRSADITAQLLAFARKQKISPSVLNINLKIEQTLQMLGRLIGERISLVWKPGENLRTVLIDPVQLDQILANLCVNARDAISGPGEIIIKTENRTKTLEEAGQPARSGLFVYLSVTDNGCGMTELIKSKIFDPFFTTKELGRGTGLGLATVYGIVKQNQGHIEVHSTPHAGTRFDIFFPAAEAESGNRSGNDAVEMPRGNSEVILLVEDEIAILKLTRKIVEGLNYRVIACESPARALEVANDPGQTIDLLLTDVVMPEMNGRELYEKICEQRPGMPVLYVSGYSADVIGVQGYLESRDNFLEKPFSIKQLAAKLVEVLKKTHSDDGPTGGSPEA
ncbi:MAG: transporter substrate-binding domain-containing protein [Candidatus Riflebacteria bacterium]